MKRDDVAFQLTLLFSLPIGTRNTKTFRSFWFDGKPLKGISLNIALKWSILLSALWINSWPVKSVRKPLFSNLLLKSGRFGALTYVEMEIFSGGTATGIFVWRSDDATPSWRNNKKKKSIYVETLHLSELKMADVIALMFFFQRCSTTASVSACWSRLRGNLLCGHKCGNLFFFFSPKGKWVSFFCSRLL